MEPQERRKQIDEQRCIFCGGKLSFDGQEMASHRALDYDGDEVAMVHYVRCKVCGRDYEVVDPTAEERATDYKDYWDKEGAK